MAQTVASVCGVQVPNLMSMTSWAKSSSQGQKRKAICCQW